MKKLGLFLVPTLLGSALLPISAAPKTASERTEAAAKKRAMAFLDQSVRAYTKLRGLSMNYTSLHTEDGKTTREMGLLGFERTGRSRITNLMSPFPKGSSIIQSHIFPAGSLEATNALEGALRVLPSQATYYFSDLVVGRNPFGREQDFFRRVHRIKGGVSGSILMQGEAPFVVTLSFDPMTHLLRRAHVQNGHIESALFFSDIRINPVFTPNFFVQPKRELDTTAPLEIPNVS